MKIEAIDCYYLSMPNILDTGDGSQDALLIRVQAGEYVGWGECEAAPLVSIASLVCPMSHSACKPVRASLLDQELNDTADINRIGNLVRENSMDLLQTDHTQSGVDIAMWDLMGKKLDAPVYQLLGYKKSYPKTPYASLLFGDTPQETLEKALRVRADGYKAVKFGWGPFGRGTVAEDEDQLHAAREGLSQDGLLLVDVGTVWGDDVERASQRLKAFQETGVTWVEEPFVSGALDSYRTLASMGGDIKLAGGEGCHNYHMAQQMIDHAALGCVQIDAGRIGGISICKRVADYAHARGISYVNHTFTSHLALSASIQAYAGLEHDTLCEYPVESQSLGVDMTQNHIERDANGQIHLPEAPGLGIRPDLLALEKYLVDVEIKVHNQVIYRTPTLPATA
ncbi:MAG: mandelate racemase/muconate lactonizing enzyme family protein [Halieaceae bacterium]|nr:mandelate racemase/muconate lactonizing enzyme family protein [Halieaceae bacterium]